MRGYGWDIIWSGLVWSGRVGMTREDRVRAIVCGGHGVNSSSADANAERCRRTGEAATHRRWTLCVRACRNVQTNASIFQHPPLVFWRSSTVCPGRPGTAGSGWCAGAEQWPRGGGASGASGASGRGPIRDQGSCLQSRFGRQGSGGNVQCPQWVPCRGLRRRNLLTHRNSILPCSIVKVPAWHPEAWAARRQPGPG